MLITINIPDTLPDERFRQRIREIEKSLREEAEFLDRMKDMRQLSSENDDKELFWKSFGSWKDDRIAEEIIMEIHAARNSPEREITL